MTATVKVRIAVAVDNAGRWNAIGCNGFSDAEKMEIVDEQLDSGEARYWITAELPIPTTPEIAGTVEEEAPALAAGITHVQEGFGA